MKNYSFEKLEPRGLLTWFKKICSIPHGSQHEQALSEMLMHELNKAGCHVKQFATGALYAKKDATKGFEKKPMLTLQAHMDMVLTKNPKLKIDLLTTPVKPYYDTNDDHIKCDGTTLGADNGIGVAAIMEIMTSNKYKHGPLEAVLSVCEEWDMSSCWSTIPDNFLKGKHLFSLDNDVPDKMYVSSNGSKRVDCEKKLDYKPIRPRTKTYQILASQFDGGHSALMIHNPNNNAACWLAEALLSFSQEHSKVSLIDVEAGQAVNAIPTYCKMTIQLDTKDIDELKKHLSHALQTAKKTAQGLDLKAKVAVQLAKKQLRSALTYEDTENFLFFLAFTPHGIHKMDITMKHIFSSSNLGVIRTKNKVVKMSFLPRSFSYGDLDRHFNTIKYFGKIAGITNYVARIYSHPWLTEHPEKSPTIKLWSDCYHKVTGNYSFPVKDPGGIEPSEIVRKNPHLANHIITVGPRIREEHSIRERVELKTIKEFWNTLLLALKEVK